MKQELIDKYNVSVPRYTSYPPANFFRTFTEEEYLQDVELSNKARNNNLSFYFHMPYCRRLCHYCGCNSYPMQKEAQVREYVDALHKEIDLVVAHLDRNRRISQIHYGGGSPTAMPVSALKELNEHLLSLFDTIAKPEIAIECHPGYLTKEDWQGLVEARFNRFSIGVQDFNLEVLQNYQWKISCKSCVLQGQVSIWISSLAYLFRLQIASNILSKRLQSYIPIVLQRSVMVIVRGYLSDR